MMPQLVTCLIGMHASFSWARRRFFRIVGPTHLGERVIEVTGTASVLSGALLIASCEGPLAWTDTSALAVSTVNWECKTVDGAALGRLFWRNLA